jgi:hypothetical protein
MKVKHTLQNYQIIWLQLVMNIICIFTILQLVSVKKYLIQDYTNIKAEIIQLLVYNNSIILQKTFQ